MTNDQIRKKLAKLEERLTSLEQQKQTTLLEIRHTRETCGHVDIKQWTNNDGYGQFVVERCNVCGLQKDGGLK